MADYLASIAPPELVAALRGEIENPTTPAARPVGGTDTTGAANAWQAALKTVREIEESVGVVPADPDFAAIDLLVVDDFVPPAVPGDAHAERVAAELAAVRAALAATGDGRWDDAREAMRELPRRSVFRHWRMFLRGVRCVFADDFRTARQCFAELPHGGAPARAAGVIAPELLPAAAAAAPTNATVAFLLALSGQPTAWAGPLTEAVLAWRSGNGMKAFAALARGLKDRFPSAGAELPALLTDAVLPFLEKMSPGEMNRADDIMHEIVSLPGLGFTQRLQLTMAATRAMCLAEAETTSPAILRPHWESVLKAWREARWPDRLRKSLAWQWFGEATVKR